MPGKRRRLRLVLALAGALLLGAVGFWLWSGLGVLGGYASKSVCSCLFVTGRDVPACLADLAAEGITRVDVRLDRAAGRVEAGVLGLRRGRAELQGDGCVLR